ncbi:MAG: type II toxin-antitoxin system Phd/YefM family antitoxin, partial [Lautropia sp.]
PRIVQQAERGDAVRITRRGVPVAVLLSEDEYIRLTMARPLSADVLQGWRREMQASGTDHAQARVRTALIRMRDIPGSIRAFGPVFLSATCCFLALHGFRAPVVGCLLADGGRRSPRREASVEPDNRRSDVMSEGRSLGDRWLAFQPTKTMAFWCCIVVAIATMFIGFGLGGWMTGGTVKKMVSQAVDEARAELVANACVARYAAHDTFAKDLASLKAASSWKQGGIVAEGGWATLEGMKEPLDDAARLCANKLVAMDAPVAATTKAASTQTPGS